MKNEKTRAVRVTRAACAVRAGLSPFLFIQGSELLSTSAGSHFFADLLVQH